MTEQAHVTIYTEHFSDHAFHSPEQLIHIDLINRSKRIGVAVHAWMSNGNIGFDSFDVYLMRYTYFTTQSDRVFEQTVRKGWSKTLYEAGILCSSFGYNVPVLLSIHGLSGAQREIVVNILQEKFTNGYGRSPSDITLLAGSIRHELDLPPLEP